MKVQSYNDLCELELAQFKEIKLPELKEERQRIKKFVARTEDCMRWNTPEIISMHGQDYTIISDLDPEEQVYITNEKLNYPVGTPVKVEGNNIYIFTQEALSIPTKMFEDFDDFIVSCDEERKGKVQVISKKWLETKIQNKLILEKKRQEEANKETDADKLWKNTGKYNESSSNDKIDGNKITARIYANSRRLNSMTVNIVVDKPVNQLFNTVAILESKMFCREADTFQQIITNLFNAGAEHVHIGPERINNTQQYEVICTKRKTELNGIPVRRNKLDIIYRHCKNMTEENIKLYNELQVSRIGLLNVTTLALERGNSELNFPVSFEAIGDDEFKMVFGNGELTKKYENLIRDVGYNASYTTDTINMRFKELLKLTEQMGLSKGQTLDMLKEMKMLADI